MIAKGHDMATLVEALLDDALAEVTLRESTYLARFPVRLAPPDLTLARYRGSAPASEWGDDDLRDALRLAGDALAARGARPADDGDARDPVAEMLVDSAMDALAASTGRLSLRPSGRPSRPLGATLPADYARTRHGGGPACFRRRSGRERGGRPLVLLNAIGIPLRIWSTFLDGADHDLDIVAIGSLACDLIEGGMTGEAALGDDVAAVCAVLDAEGIGDADLLAWSNAGRVALEFAARHPERTRSITLVSPTLRGSRAADRPFGPFEEQLYGMFDAIAAREASAELIARAVRSQLDTPDEERWPQDSARRADLLFGLPASEHAHAVARALTTAESLVRYRRRTVSDEAHDIDATLRRIRAPLLTITGTHDQVVNNDLALAALRAAGLRFTHASISGAGHYTFDLQYRYFIRLLSGFLAGAVPAPCFRVDIVSEGGGAEALLPPGQAAGSSSTSIGVPK